MISARSCASRLISVPCLYSYPVKLWMNGTFTALPPPPPPPTTVPQMFTEIYSSWIEILAVCCELL